MKLLTLVSSLMAVTSAAPQGYTLPEPSGSNNSINDCKDGEILHVDGRCVVPKITRHLFLFNAPEQSHVYGPPPVIPPPKINHNVLFIQAGQRGPEPIIVPPPRQRNTVYILSNKSDQGQRVIEFPAPPSKSPEVYFINYGEGDNPTLPGGIDFQTALNSAVQGDSQLIVGAEQFTEDDAESLEVGDGSVNINETNIGDGNVVNYDNFASNGESVPIHLGLQNGETHPSTDHDPSSIDDGGNSNGNTGIVAMSLEQQEVDKSGESYFPPTHEVFTPSKNDAILVSGGEVKISDEYLASLSDSTSQAGVPLELQTGVSNPNVEYILPSDNVNSQSGGVGNLLNIADFNSNNRATISETSHPKTPDNGDNTPSGLYLAPHNEAT
ncbi:uncharacterized protein LOC121864297 [Homarus americanus]|uniref:uncharacterized protein LOC121864297 n=1 Tax=Homarus americanus TaxID=6706 RepID=UPI001C48077A|nr:uncharacterized protein LOC121864297 [Homarus americanus]